MSVYRKNLITNDWVIFAPRRAERPVELGKQEADNVELLKQRPEYRDGCPFCAGNENPDDREVFQRERDGHWQARILQNKYASVDREVTPQRRCSRFKKEIDGYGIHDVIIDHPRHDMTLALMTEEDIRDLLTVYLTRYRQLVDTQHVKHVVIFKNQGFKAGGSLEHPHSQVYGLPVIPFETRVRLGEVEKYYDFNDMCLMCAIREHEEEDRERIIYQNEHFTAWTPYAALSPYHIWIVPKRHSPSFQFITLEEIKGLSEVMKRVFGKLFKHLRNPDFNYVFQSLTHCERERDYFHWYISLIPQMKRRGGIEYAGGLFVNPVMPEQAAEDLRRVDVSDL